MPMLWSSIAFSFEKPAEVVLEERTLAAWAYLRRRSNRLGSFLDAQDTLWEEYVDAESCEYFYWNMQSKEHRWGKPEVPTRKDHKENLNVGDKVLYRFVEGGPEVVCRITKCRVDDSTV